MIGPIVEELIIYGIQNEGRSEFSAADVQHTMTVHRTHINSELSAVVQHICVSISKSQRCQLIASYFPTKKYLKKTKTFTSAKSININWDFRRLKI